MHRLRYALARWRYHRMMKPIDRQIAKAKRLHRPVAHLYAAKTALLHRGLQRGR